MPRPKDWMSAGAAGDVLGYPELPDEFHGASHRSTLLHSRVSARTGTGGATMSGRRCHRSVIYIYIYTYNNACLYAYRYEYICICIYIYICIYAHAYMHNHLILWWYMHTYIRTFIHSPAVLHSVFSPARSVLHHHSRLSTISQQAKTCGELQFIPVWWVKKMGGVIPTF